VHVSQSRRIVAAQHDKIARPKVNGHDAGAAEKGLSCLRTHGPFVRTTSRRFRCEATACRCEGAYPSVSKSKHEWSQIDRTRNRSHCSEAASLTGQNHLRFISTQPCTVCGRQPCEAHHIRYQPRALGRRVSDEFTMPLCRLHHRELHRQDDERAWWSKFNLISILCPMHSGFGSTPEGSMIRSNQQPNRLATCQSSNHLLSFQTHSVGALA
jgi:hypothetical protein